ncbi:MAG: hypothetical protein ACI9D8_000603 [Reinekea sp.]|jgi:hypothetical protein|tara:strand:- start:24 stop:404 length:381 start_codon:yes stop_codon:yes gene_type:complete
MTAHFRTLVFMLMFGVFMSNNIMVPVHQLGHIQDKHERVSVHEFGHIHDHHERASLHESSHTHDDQEASLTSCDAYHAIHTIALPSNGYGAYVARPSRCINTQRDLHVVTFTTNLATPIRAPPFKA